jgi:hypothetical protein
MLVYLKRMLNEALRAGLLAVLAMMLRQLITLIRGDDEADTDYPLEC